MPTFRFRVFNLHILPGDYQFNAPGQLISWKSRHLCSDCICRSVEEITR
jgi:hypothetical protein